MARASAARRAALSVLGEVRRREGHARDIMRDSSALMRLDDRDRSFAVRVVLGVIAAQGYLDTTIDHHITRGKLEPKVRDALHIGAYELLFLSTPARAAVSQVVELVRASTPRAAGLANAVMRRVATEDVPAREAAHARAAQGEGTCEDFAWVSGYPLWLLERVADNRGVEAARSMALSALEAAPIYVAGNRVLVSDDEAERLLVVAGLEPHSSREPGSFVLGKPAGLADSGLVESAQVVVSDLAAQHVANTVSPVHDARLLEVGQGRGTKSILIQNQARRYGASVYHVGVDVEPFKVEVATRRMKRAGLGDVVSCAAFDACALCSDDVPAGLAGPFDVVFVDAPCSGVGTLRRHPEIVWSLRPCDVDALAHVQERMLAAASTRVAKGGMLCYSTCSVFRQENEQTIERFLSSEAGRSFELVEEPFQTLPEPAGPDGHFLARMRQMH